MLNSEQSLQLASLIAAAYLSESAPPPADGVAEPGARHVDPQALSVLRDWVARQQVNPAELLFAASGQGVLPFRTRLTIPARAEELAGALLDTLTECDHAIRWAAPTDMERLLDLERLCWPAALATPAAVIAQRIERYPEGQLVVEHAGKVQGVIYSQRIDSADDLFGVTAATVDQLFSPHAAIVQLLAINIDPAVQDRRLGDRLLEFMLIYRALQKDTQSVVAVTRCLSFARQSNMSLSEYIQTRNDSGVLADPILRFHELHGARIAGLVPGYRPLDQDNRGHGVLVTYRPRDRHRTDLPVSECAAAADPRPAWSARDLGRIIEEAIREARDIDAPGEFDPALPLMELGLDSAAFLKLNDMLRHRLQVSLPPTFFFRHNTALKIQQALVERFSSAADAIEPQPAPAAPAPLEQPRLGGEEPDIAIIGLACRLPGGIDTPEDFWSLLRSGGGVVTRRPEERWHWPEPIPDQERFRGIDYGAYLPDPWRFDAAFFRIAPVEAESMDPHQRILLEVCWEALSSAGLRPSAMARSATGVFVGASNNGDFARLIAESHTAVEAHAGTGQSMAILANRISYFFDFEGPSLVIDTACSSSLVALHAAVRALRQGECSQALVTGINLLLHPAPSLAYAAAGMLSRDGVCRTFDHRASGYVRGEGAVAVLLKPLRQARADGDVIHAVIQGSAVNHGGQTGGLTVPHPGRQARLIRSAWADAGIEPTRLRYIETHGTGTPLGDPIEIEGIGEAFAREPTANRPSGLDCGLGSVKTNCGHLEAAAGLLGLLKVVMCLKHREWPALAHFERLNPKIDLGAEGPHLMTERTPFGPARADRPVFAGVSSFGSGGTNAHVVLRDHAGAAPAPRGGSGESVLFAFSARSERKLLETCRSHLAWLDTGSEHALDLRQLSHWLRFGRESMPSRLACVAASRAELMEHLARFLRDPAAFRAAPPPPGAEDSAPLWMLARQWMDHTLADWPPENAGQPPKPDWLYTLPHYPFERTAYGPPGRRDSAAATPAGVAPNPDIPATTSLSPTEDQNPAATLLAPTWTALGGIDVGLAAARPAGERVFLLATSAPLRDSLARQSSRDGQVLLPAAPADFIEQLRPGDEVIYVAGAPSASALSGQRVAALRSEGVGGFFALVKQLQERGLGDASLRLTVVTFRGLGVHPAERIDPSHAGLHGLAGVVGHEFPTWRVQALDLDDEATLLALCRKSLAGSFPVGPLAIRAGVLWRQRFIPVAHTEALPPLRHNGVYLILGGSGGIGEAWTRHLVSRYQAQVLWIGRRPLDEAIRGKITAIGTLGPAPRYYPADATCPEALSRVLADIRAAWPDIHGVVHALMGPFDTGIRSTPFAAFMDSLKPKMDAGVHLVGGLGSWTPDFLLFLSSTVALEQSGGYCGYASGCAFEDALAHSLARSAPWRVLAVNSAPWAVGSGERIAEAIKIRYRNSGHLPLATGEAIAGLEQAIGLPFAQAALVKARDLRNLPFVDAAEHRIIAWREDPDAPPLEGDPRGCRYPDPPSRALSHFANPDFDAALLARIGEVLARDPVHARPGGPAELRVLPKYETWLGLIQERLAAGKRDATIAEGAPEAPALSPARRLADACLDALPRVLTGRTAATEVLFPAGSMRLVEGIYRDNPVADYFNEVLAESLQNIIAAAREARPGTTLRILEIGAGTGGTTARVLPWISPHADGIAEYAYTDVSKRFLNHAEEVFGSEYPFVRPRLFDVGVPPARQGLMEGSYDILIATNTLHATPDIRATLTHAKALLRKGGLLFLNELTANSIFAHLTFGLLDGWWLTRDHHFRIPHSPILAPEQWDWLLASCGFQDIRHPCQAASILGQQIFIARSDGIVVTSSASVSLSAKPAEPRMNPTPESAAPAPISRIPSGPPREELRPLCETYLASVMAGILRMRPAEIDPTEPLGNYGIDSILTVQITEALKSRIPEVPSTLLFEAQTVRGLAAYLIEHHPARVAEALDVREPPAGPAAAERHPTPPPASASCTPAPAPLRQAPQLPREPGQSPAIAIIGMSCRFPGCDNPDEFWELLAAGRSAIGEIPPDRWPIEGFYEPDPDRAIAEGKSYSKWGGFLKDITHFDPLFFNILPRDAELIDPQERLFLQAAWHALEDGGYTIERIGQEFNHSLGVYAGATRTGFDLFGPPLWAAGDTRYPHTTFASIANRVSFFLNAHGPSVPVDTMCSSSLTAIHQACQGLLHGECRLAIAGGVNLYLHPSAYVGLSQLRMFSRDGVCRSFGKGGNGFVAGEGVACVLLKPLDQALADGDRIHAVIRATQVNHGGRTNGYTVPNPKAQAELIRATLDRAGVSARRVSYVEAHGTGTELGDPIEISGLTQAFRRDTEDTGYCAIGSVKTNIGHLEATAGIAGLIKVVLQMQHRQLAPSLHAAELNPRIAFADTPFRVQTTLAEWRPHPDALPGAGDAGSRLAGVSSFGAGGANAHVLLEEFRAEQPGPDMPLDGRLPFVFSARTREQLNDVAARALAYLEALGSDTVTRPGLADLAFTLQTGREALAERLGFLAGNLEEVRAALAAFLEERESPELSLRRGHQRQSRELLADLGPAHLVDDLIDRCFAQSIYETLVALWVKGVTIPWRALHERHPKGARAPHWVALPGYPFARTAFPLPGLRQDAGTTPATLPVPPRIASPSPAPLAVAPGNFAPQECRSASGLRLTDPKAHRLPKGEIPPRVSIRLPPLQDRKPSSAAIGALPGAFVAVAEGILAVDFGTFTATPDTLARHLETLYGTPTESAKVLILKGLEALADDWATPAERASLSRTLAATPSICLAVLRGHPSRLAVSLARACDLVAFAEEGDYPVAALALSIPAEPEQRISGTRLREAGVSAAIHPAAALDEQVLSLAGSIAQGTAASLAELKRVFRNPGEWATRDSRDPAPFMDLPPSSESADPAGMEPAAARAVPLRSAVVRLEWLPPGIALLRLEDRVHRNTSSPELVAGVIEAFGVIGRMDEAKVVVVTGFDNYFACGGTREGLLAIQQGRMRFTDEQSYLMPLLCDLPVIAAMQGHAIGAGWALGLFADLAIHAEESIYQSPYMLYGFTPGAGSTFIFPERLGEPLAWEILFSGREYRGAELARRHRAVLARPRSRVLATALSIARHWAEHPRDLLIGRKRASVQAIRAAIPQVFERELALHDRTFVGNPSVLMGIERHFRPASPALQAEPAAPLVAAAAGPRPDDQVQALTAWLLESLGDELGIPPTELDTQAAFIDLGIDSISAVTWVRKINQRFSLNLPATIVYRHPTVADLARDVVERLPEAPRPAAPQLPRAELPVADRSAPPPVTAAADREGVEQWLRTSLARELLIAPEDIEEDTRFVDLGLDSVNAVTWIRSINQHFGVAIPATTVYAYPSLTLLAGYLQPLAGTRGRATEPPALVPAALSPERSEPPAAAESPAMPPPRPTAEPVSAVQLMAAAEPGPSCAVAIIGMAGQFPQAPNLRAFWENLAKARDCVSEIPPSRWAIADYYEPSRILPGKTICKRMGVLEDIDQFDPLFFNISPAEAELMDPQQRLFLENSWHCIEDAGYDPLALAGSRCGIFVGCEKGDYSRRTQDQPDSAHGLIGESVAILPARVAYYLDLKGPCLAMDTACSASLVAINTACDNLALGHCDLALAGGVCVLNGPEIHIKMSNAGMLSPDGRCHTFDQRANGFVPGEGVGVVLLKPLAQAEADGDPIYAVIKAWGTNQDGRTNGITAPNPLAQAELERAVYRRYGIDPRAIGHVEAHGTGTALGDPIEIEGLTSAFRTFTEDRHFCALTSVKSNIGHLATAAGVAGVIKSALALERRQIPPSIHHQRLNEHIDLDHSPFFVNTRLRDWPPVGDRKRLAAVSSFGFSGTNAHLVLEEYPPPVRRGVETFDRPFHLFTLSARSETQLEAYAATLARWITGPAAEASVAAEDLARTLQASRASMEYRLAVVCRTLDELARRLDDFTAKVSGATDGLWHGCVEGRRMHSEVPLNRIDSGDRAALAAVAQQWVTGASLPASCLAAGRRIHGVPGYPFAHERYWFDPPAAAPVSTATPAGPSADPAESATLEVPILTPETGPAAASPPVPKTPAPQPLRPSWRETPLPADHDWAALGRETLGRALVVSCSDPALGRAFAALLNEIGQRVAPDRDPACTMITPGQAIPGAEPGGILNVLILDTSECQAIQHFLTHFEQLPPCLGLRVLAFAPAGPEQAESLGDAFLNTFRRGRDLGLLVTHPPGLAPTAAAQQIIREWLAFEASQIPGVGVLQLHLEAAGARRLSRIPPAIARDQALQLTRDWIPRARRRMDAPPRRGSLLVLASQQTLELAAMVATELPGFDHVLLVGDQTVAADNVGHRLDFNDPAATRFGTGIFVDTNQEITHLLDLIDLDARPSAIPALDAGRVVFYQVLVGACRRLTVLHLTRRLRAFQSDHIHLGGAGVYGLIRVLGAEYPYVRAKTIDLDEALSLRDRNLLSLVAEEFAADGLDSELCYRNGTRYEPSLRLQPIPVGTAPVPRLSSGKGVYVITGGTSGLGLEIARLFADRGGINLVLLGSSPLPPQAEWGSCLSQAATPAPLAARLRHLLEIDERVDQLEIGTPSLADRNAVEAYFAELTHRLGPVLGVIHCAAARQAGEGSGFFNADLDAFGKMFATKAAALQWLSRAVETEALQFFMTFGPMSLLIPQLARGGIPGATTHGFIEAFNAAGNLRLQRTVYSLLAWPDWLCSGALARAEPTLIPAIVQAFERVGMRLLSRKEGMLLLTQALHSPGAALAGLAYGDYQTLASRLDEWHQVLHTPDAPPLPTEPGPADAGGIINLIEAWEALQRAGGHVSPRDIGEKISPEELEKLDQALILRLHALVIGHPDPASKPESGRLMAPIRQAVMDVLKLKSLDPSKSFQSYGLDSITAMVLATRLEKVTQVPVEPQSLIQHCTLDRLSRFLEERQAGA